MKSFIAILLMMLSLPLLAVDQKIYAPTGKLILDSNSSLVLKPNGGSVGVGTSTPANLFSVIGSNTSDAIMSVSSGNIVDGYRVGYKLKNTHTGGREYSIITTNNTDGTFGGGKFAIQDLTAGAENYRVVIDNAGKVGIGITAPSQKLTVASGAVEAAGGLTNGHSQLWITAYCNTPNQSCDTLCAAMPLGETRTHGGVCFAAVAHTTPSTGIACSSAVACLSCVCFGRTSN